MAETLAADLDARRAFDALPAHVAVLDPDGVIIRVNTSWRRFAADNGARHPDAFVGENYLSEVRRAISAGDAEAREVLPGLEIVLSGAEPSWETTYPCPGRRGVAWYRMTVTRPADGAGAVVIHDDVTRLVEAEQNQRLLTQELNHRVKNTLALVQAIAGQTVRAATDVTMFRDTFLDRLQALARVHEMLTMTTWQPVDIGEVVRAALAPFRANGDATIRQSGPPAELDARAAVMLSLALHELGTNATKYGALSRPAGSVEITWTVEEAGTRLTWREQGGPPVVPPLRTGFGSRLIAGMARADGHSCMDFRPAGLVAELVLDRALASQDA